MDSTPQEPTGTQTVSHSDLLFKMGLKELELQKEMRDHLDTKTGVVLGFALVSVVEILGFMMLVAAEKDVIGAAGWPFVVSFSLGLAGVILAAFFSVVELWPLRYYFVDSDYLRFRAKRQGREKNLKLALLPRLIACSRRNDYNTDRKSRLAVWAAVAAGVALLFYSIAVMLIFLALWHTARGAPTGNGGVPTF